MTAEAEAELALPPTEADIVEEPLPTGAGLVFDKYELVRRLAIGGMGEVFIARQVSDVQGFERHVILKSLLPDLAAEKSFVDQFLDEARVAATLNHPNVVSVFEVGASGGTYYIAMEFIPGLNLSQLRRQSVDANHPLPPHLVARIIAEAAAGLHHAHCAVDVAGQPLHLVHRDISPHNIMLRADGLTKVVDFGIASAANRVTRTRSGVLKGKLAYMSPEQLRAQTLDGRSDQFSLGVVFWELLTQRRLFVGQNDAQLAGAVLKAPITPPSRDGSPPGLDAIVLKMLERDVQQRFATCAEVESALEQWLRSQPHPSDRAALAAHFREVGGTGQTEQSLNTPDDFVIALRSRDAQPRGTVEMTSSVERSVRSRGRIVAVLAATALAALAVTAVTLWQNGAQSQVSTNGTPPAPPIDAAIETPRPAKLSLASKPSGAKVQLDGEWLESPTPLTVPVEPGVAHRVHLELKGHKGHDLAVPAVDAGAIHELEVALTPERAPANPGRAKAEPRPPPQPVAAPTPATLTVRAEPAAAIWLDDEQPRPVGTLFGLKVPPGAHTIHLRTESGRVTHKQVTLNPGQDHRFSYKLDP